MDVIASSNCPQCLDYMIIGTCVWMTCTPFGCSTSTSVKVKHRLPDTVVMSYPETGNAPWQDTAWMSPENKYSKGGGKSHRRSVQGLDRTSLTFQNVDVIGHPGASSVYELLSGFGYFIKSPATAFMPYYLSSLDPLGWRYNIPDAFTLNSLNPFGQKLGNFGSVYPRGGFALQKHPFKSAALAAFKAEHLITRQGESRVYQPLAATYRPGFWPPKPVSASVDNHETKFQQLYPNIEMNAYIWPQFNDRLSMSDPYAKQISDDGQYVWAVWRMYKGCKRRGSQLIAHFGD
ncbi:integrating conjugative element protein [Vibrio sp. MACH09]|nr:integrating conjugative element protein [Vibrio sp. MACH09]